MTMTMRALTGVPALAVALVLAVASPAAAAPAACDPFTQPSLRGDVPTAKQVIGIDLGERDVTTEESDRYLLAVDAASPRVTSGVAAVSQQGRPLRYAVVGKPGRVTPKGLQDVRAAAAKLMDPRTSDAEAASIARRDPAILWIAANVHGGEESGTDASLRTLYELADRDDCAAKRILDESVVVILPTQNPDGREADTRRNAYGFDMNRDWFARTQPETDGKLELLRRYPGVLFIDAHEMGRASYFFPPNADPIYHEITDQAVDWINNVYGAAMQDEFDKRGIPYFNYDIYDLFYMGYGDTVPSTGFGAAGMTFEKASGDPAQRRVLEQYVTQWTSLSAAAIRKQQILAGWHDAWVEAERQGRAGRLEPNEVVQPQNTVQRQVPDIAVRHYFIRADEPAKAREAQALVRRLQRMDVVVRRLTAPLSVPDYTPYGRGRRSATLPAGTYWVSMAQRQKHWVQAMLNEDPYTPFPYFYDTTAWSQALLFNLAAGYSGSELSPQAERVADLPDPGQPAAPAAQPEIAIYQISQTSSTSIESSGWLRWLLDQWRLRHRTVTPAEIAAGGLAATKVLIVPDGNPTTGANALGATGAQALRDWVSGGGRLVAWSGGGALAARLGISSARFTTASSEGLAVPGTMFRVAVDQGSPLAAGVGDFAYAYHLGDYVMRQPDAAKVPLRYPPSGSEDFFFSGYAEGEEALGGTAAASDERYGSGRAVVFGFEPNFRAFTDGTQKALRNALLGADPATAGITARPAARARAVAAAEALAPVQSALQLVVRRRGEAAARKALGRYGAHYRVYRTDGRTTFLIANPGEKVGDEHPYAHQLGATLRKGKVPVVMFRAP
jgi:hypothetical protein